MPKSLANFWFESKFYKRGSEIPESILEHLGDHLYKASEAPAKASTPAAPKAPAVEPKKEAESDAQATVRDADYFNGLDAQALGAAAKEAGIGGKMKKAELIELLVAAHSE